MKGLLVRIGVDQAYGNWNAPADPKTGEFIYLPIPENKQRQFHPNCRRSYSEFLPALEKFAARRRLNLDEDLRFPRELMKRDIHLDPDYEYLTYGNRANSKNSVFRKLESGDLVVFYAGMRSVEPEDGELVYGIVGLFVVDEVLDVPDVARASWHENAHTRKIKHASDDIVIWGKPRVSGRLSRYLPIGEFRSKAYRVRLDVLGEWGELSVKDGYIQRSAVPPWFENAEKFYRWFKRQRVRLLRRNN